MSTRDEIIERAARGMHALTYDPADWRLLDDDDIDAWRTDAAAAIDALTVEDLLTLAGLVGDDAPFETVGRLRTCLYDAADIIEFETQSPDTGLVADLKQAAQTLVEGPDR